MPVGRLTLPCWSALRDLVDADLPRRRAACGSSSTRTAYFCAPNTLHLRDAADHRHALREHGLGVLVDLRQRQRRRAERQEEDRLVGRVDLLERRRRRHARRQLPRRRGDRRLHVLRGGVDVAVEIELQRDVACCPAMLVEVIESRPAIVENCFSSGVATDEAIVSGLAPGRLALTWIVGKSTFGRSLTGSAGSP